MSPTSTATVMTQYVTALRERVDCATFLAPGVVWTTMETGNQVQGRGAVGDFILAMHTRIFDGRLEVVSLICGDGAATLEAVFDGKHTADFVGQPATGTHVRLPHGMA